MISIEEFQAEVTNFLKANADEKADEQRFVWGEGSDKVAMFEERDRDTELTIAGQGPGVAGQAVRRRLRLDHRPDEYGGRGSRRRTSGPTTPLEAKFDVPNQSFFTIGLGMVAPTILAHGTRGRQGAPT